MSKILSKRLFLTLFAFCFLLSAALVGCSGIKDDVYVNQQGKQVRLSDYDGKVVLMNFVFTSCPHGGCDLLTTQFLRVQTLLRDRVGKDLFLVSISIDPKNDTPEILNNYAKKYMVDPSGWHFLSSNKRTIDRISDKHGLEWKTGDDGDRHHKAVVVLFNKKGKKVIVYNDKNYDTMEMVKDIEKLLGPGAGS